MKVDAEDRSDSKQERISAAPGVPTPGRFRRARDSGWTLNLLSLQKLTS
jgi:hypothetical protein